MKKIVLLFGILFSLNRLLAQTNTPVRLALISETDEALPAVDILTAQLSGNEKIQLLERDQIEKIYREQGLSAANADYLKLGKILGADGLLLFDVVRTAQATNLTARLIAVKPGVILTDGNFDWPLKDTAQWTESISAYLNSFLPKLAVLPKDAIPISVVNLRSAISSAEATETERQLKLLIIQRLSQERQFFVLERQKMQLLGDEKELKADDSTFWDGSYLLEGVVDQNGYSENTITINARLTPPKGGAPILLEASGSRTNLAEVINQLAVKVGDALKISSDAPAWNAADEAMQYFEEAKWALRWGICGEAQAAADSAWALGRHDMDCATIRIKAYEVPPDTGGYQTGEFTNPGSTNEVVQSAVEDAGSNQVFGLVWQEQNFGGTKVVRYVSAGKFPDPKSIDFVRRALALYYEFSQTLPPDEPKADSAWYRLGIEDLTATAQVLQHFNFVPESQKNCAEKLADLRALARSVAAWISKSPSVHDSFFVGDRLATHDELASAIGEQPNIFRCEVNWGCFWQETPADDVALYRELMSSPVFCYIHNDFWFRELQKPRLTAWNDEDRGHGARVWDDFTQELNNSTNVLLQLEAKAVKLAEADDEKQLAASFTNFFSTIFENRDALVANPVEVLYLDWGADDLVSAKTGNGIASATKDSLNHLFYSEYSPKLTAMDQEYWSKTVPTAQSQSGFGKQKEYLKSNKPYDFMEFTDTFGSRDYTRAEALEIQPLVTAYKSNLVAQLQSAAGIQKGELMGAVGQVGFLEDDVNRILNPPTPKAPAQPQISQSAPAAKTVVTSTVFTNAPEMVTNILMVGKFTEIPLDSLIQLSGLGTINGSTVTIAAHHWSEGKLLLDFDYTLWNNQTGGADGTAIAMLDPTTGHWDVISRPKVEVESQNRFYHRTTLLHGELFNCDGGQIKKYDFQNQQWKALPISDGNNYQLFTVNGQLYAASHDIIVEILDDGKSTKILASTRRNPPVSALDQENFGTPALFAGPEHSLRVSTANKIFTWTGNDWREDSAAPPASSPPEIFLDGILFHQDGDLNAGYQNGNIFRQSDGTYGVLVQRDAISSLGNDTNAANLCLNSGNRLGNYQSGAKPVQVQKTFWERPENLLPNLPAALRESDLYLFEDTFAAHAVINDHYQILQENIAATNGYNAALLCFSPDLPSPQKLFLKFDASNASMPAWIFPATDQLILGNSKGVWLVPFSQLDPAISAQKQIQLAQKAQAVAATQQAAKNLLAKYDLNRNGIIDPDEKEAALDDPAFIASELDAIDTNHNGWLDASELIYFDANKNKILDSKEQAGIEIAQHLFAEKLLKKFDANDDGVLDHSEFNNLFQSSFATGQPSTPVIQRVFPDDNRDGKIDLGELESFLKQQTRKGLRMRGVSSAALINQMQMNANGTVNPQQLFKLEVEAYWQKDIAP